MYLHILYIGWSDSSSNRNRIRIACWKKVGSLLCTLEWIVLCLGDAKLNYSVSFIMVFFSIKKDKRDYGEAFFVTNTNRMDFKIIGSRRSNMLRTMNFTISVCEPVASYDLFFHNWLFQILQCTFRYDMIRWDV